MVLIPIPFLKTTAEIKNELIIKTIVIPTDAKTKEVAVNPRIKNNRCLIS